MQGRGLAYRTECQRDHGRTKPDHEGADGQAGVVAPGIEHETTGAGAQRHAQARKQGDGAKHSAHDARAERIGFSNALLLPHGAPNTALDGPRRV